MVNINPEPIKIRSIRFQDPNLELTLTSNLESLQEDFQPQNNDQNQQNKNIIINDENIKKMMQIPIIYQIEPNDSLYIQFEIRGNKLGKFDKKIIVETDYELLVVPLSYEVLQGKITLIPKTIRFQQGFPGNIQIEKIAMINPFSQRIHIQRVSVTNQKLRKNIL